MTPEDREMLEMAARAAGYELALPASPGMRWSGEDQAYIDWNPLKDNGDAFRLAVKLGIGLLPEAVGVRKGTAICHEGFGWHIFDGLPDDPLAAARLAICKAAAHIGRSMP